jgi:hypothetical protein
MRRAFLMRRQGRHSPYVSYFIETNDIGVARIFNEADVIIADVELKGGGRANWRKWTVKNVHG